MKKDGRGLKKDENSWKKRMEEAGKEDGRVWKGWKRLEKRMEQRIEGSSKKIVKGRD